MGTTGQLYAAGIGVAYCRDARSDGTAAYLSSNERNPTLSFFSCQTSDIKCDWYRFKPTLQEDMARADMIISHAGAGSVMEALGEEHPSTGLRQLKGGTRTTTVCVKHLVK